MNVLPSTSWQLLAEPLTVRLQSTAPTTEMPSSNTKVWMPSPAL